MKKNIPSLFSKGILLLYHCKGSILLLHYFFNFIKLAFNNSIWFIG